jgi:CheY-like chemotaxis protein
MLTIVTAHTGATVLVVEDDPDIREALCALLEDEGYNVYSAENGRTAACLLGDRPPPSLVITDLMMPIMDGWQLVERLRQSDRLASVPVVVISAVPPSQAPRGIRVLLRKPVNAGEVLEVVEHYAGDQHA